VKYNWRINLEKRWGQPLKFGFQCESLSDDIFRVTKIKISPQTLRRLCGFVRYQGKPSNNTILSLNQYIASSKQTEQTNINDFERDFLIPFIQDFFQIPLSSSEDFNYQNACAKIAKRLFEKTELLHEIGYYLAKNDTAQIYFFERFPYFDGLALPAYFDLLNVYAQEKKDAQSQFYAVALQCWGRKLSGQKWSDLLWKKCIQTEAHRKTWHPFLKARAIVLLIWEAEENNQKEEIQLLINWAKEEHLLLFSKAIKQNYFPYFEYLLAEGLLIAKEYEASQYFVSLYLQYFQLGKNTPIEPGYHEAIRVMQYFNAHQLEQFELRNELANSIVIEKVIFTGLRYFRILYNMIQLQKPFLHRKRRFQITEQLIKDKTFTGFNFI
jgi:hypothetical protein